MELLFDVFSDFGKNGEPFESIVKSSQIEGRAPGQSKKRYKTDGKTVKTLRGTSDALFVDFVPCLGRFWEHFGSQNAVKHRMKMLMRFWRPNQANKPVILGRLGGMRGVPGEDYGGVREPISAENRGREPRAGARSSRFRYLVRRPRWGGGSLRAFRRADPV